MLRWSLNFIGIAQTKNSRNSRNIQGTPLPSSFPTNLFPSQEASHHFLKSVLQLRDILKYLFCILQQNFPALNLTFVFKLLWIIFYFRILSQASTAWKKLHKYAAMRKFDEGDCWCFPHVANPQESVSSVSKNRWRPIGFDHYPHTGHRRPFLFLQSHCGAGEWLAKIPAIVVCTRYQVSQMAPWEGCQRGAGGVWGRYQ